MIDVGALFAASLLLFLGAASPGPSLAVVLRNTVKGSRAQGLACAVGHGLGFGLYALLAVFGLHLLMQQHQWLVVGLQLTGAALLLYMARDILRVQAASSDTAEHARGRSAGFTEGFLIALFNPKIALFFLAVFANVLSADTGRATLLTMAGIGWLIDTAWYAIVAVALPTPRASAWLGQQERRIDYVMAALFLALAVATIARVVSAQGVGIG